MLPKRVTYEQVNVVYTVLEILKLNMVPHTEDGEEACFAQNKARLIEGVLAEEDVWLVEKLGARCRGRDTGKFVFRLNHMTDPLWREIFDQKSKGLSVDIHCIKLDLTCSADCLNDDCEKLKVAIQEANREYEVCRELVNDFVLKQVQRSEVESAAATDYRGTQEVLLNEALDNIKII